MDINYKSDWLKVTGLLWFLLAGVDWSKLIHSILFIDNGQFIIALMCNRAKYTYINRQKCILTLAKTKWYVVSSLCFNHAMNAREKKVTTFPDDLHVVHRMFNAAVPFLQATFSSRYINISQIETQCIWKCFISFYYSKKMRKKNCLKAVIKAHSIPVKRNTKQENIIMKFQCENEQPRGKNERILNRQTEM